MDKNTIIGIVLIFTILIGFSYLNKPSEEEIEAARKRQDSIAQVEASRAKEAEAQAQIREMEQEAQLEDATEPDSSVVSKKATDQFGAFGQAASGEEQFITLENNLMKLTISNKGGKIYSVELKGYQTYDSLPLMLFEGDDNLFGFNFFSENRSIRTDDLYFEPSLNQEQIVVSGPEVPIGKEGRLKFNEEHGGQSQTLSMRLNAGNGRYIEYEYTLDYNSWLVGFNVKNVGLNELLSRNTNYLNFNWAFAAPRQERKSQYGEDRYTTISYKFFEDDVEKLSAAKSSEETLKTKVKWISLKQLFFNSTIIADESFPTADVRYEYLEDDPKYVGRYFADIAFPYDGSPQENHSMQFYFGPNHYTTLNQYDLSLERLIDLGYAVVRPVNKYLIIPTFNFLRKYIDNFGIIILLLTVFIKLIVFPFTYKSYISQAKMRALKPEIDELNEKFSKDKPMEKQQATMALYKKAGVNPMGGCLPMLLQFPILIAMFFFFPTSIELRQESFLWATDLSSYDSILSLPFTIPFYGNHVSLFCLLMTITTVISTKMNSQAATSQQMPGMQTMMYLMPVMFLFILNNYSSGLSYYYFLANVITIGQMYLFRHMIDEDKIRAQLQANKKKGPVKKSNFQKRLEKMAKEKGMQLPK
ncbi:membrane protein insertase YidC [Sunxiuqinia dokdonensis]|uniref:Membrane protein insertase YidC n=1 Tax=Sunxiuqinia dokdonensis TaxID=1409788 RepID=A0A0L8VF77_9BACT|nr:membrane protein insertase YidC [Sunxiuqinia dokdonensis]KOH46822.1 hypothetical protein NC99_04080 [Sunxiuqinia dokdonensis]